MYNDRQRHDDSHAYAYTAMTVYLISSFAVKIGERMLHSTLTGEKEACRGGN